MSTFQSWPDYKVSYRLSETQDFLVTWPALPPWTTPHYYSDVVFEGFQRSPQLESHAAESFQSLIAVDFPVWLQDRKLFQIIFGPKDPIMDLLNYKYIHIFLTQYKIYWGNLIIYIYILWYIYITLIYFSTLPNYIYLFTSVYNIHTYIYTRRGWHIT